MPLHRFFLPKGLYSAADKSAIAQAITKVYAILPAFYVVVVFVELDPGDFFVGGKASGRRVRINVEHVARNFEDGSPKRKRKFMERYEAALAPFTKARGIEWEVQIVDCDRLLWNIDGMAPPEENSDGERIWREEDKPVPLGKVEDVQVRAKL
ncbi:Tautomerase-3 domain-containing protein [Favolaschia claudopus]|uniref:Tautomerase-3 domain-containing protein n=1 Tax=Favolaschia claudopus TaxID=2862362 RepID=A0AAW0DG92_9AGAR